MYALRYLGPQQLFGLFSEDEAVTQRAGRCSRRCGHRMPPLPDDRRFVRESIHLFHARMQGSAEIARGLQLHQLKQELLRGMCGQEEVPETDLSPLRAV